jgi:PAS domain S-box-containing protein
MVLRKEITKEIKDLLKKNPQGLSITEIVGLIDVNRNTAGRYLENLLMSGQVEMRRFGMAKIYMLSQRVPLSAVLSMSSELVVQLDYNLRIVFTNEPFLNLIESEEKAILGKNIEYTPIAMVFDDAFAGFVQKIREGIEGKEWSGEIVLDTKNLILFCRIAPTVFEDGRKGVSVILEDVTEQRRADNALRESEDRYRTLVEISPDAVFLHRKGTIIYANPAAIRLLGGSYAEEIIGKEILDFVSPEFHDTIRTNIQKDLRGEMSPRTELYMVRLDGTPIIVEGRGTATIIDGIPTVQVAVRDITEQKIAEEALKIRERQLSSIYSNVPDVLFYLSVEPDNRFRFLTVNQSFLDKLHLQEDQVAGKYVDEVIPEPLYSRAREKYNQSIREKRTIQWEEVQDNPTGRRYADSNVTAIFDESGRPTNIIGIIHDTTGHKQLEKILRESEGKLNAMLQSIPDPMSMIDEHLTILWTNESAKRIFGEDIIGKKCYEAFHQRQVPCEPYPCLSLKAFSDKKLHHHETTVIDCQGERRFFECAANVALQDASGKPVAVLEISRDISDRRNAEEALQKSEDLYRSLAESSTDMIFVIGRDDLVEYVNSFASAIVNKMVDQIIGGPRSSLFPPDIASNQKKALEKVFETGKPVRRESPLTVAGEIHWFDHYLTPLKDTDNQVRSVLGISRDITERKRMEMALRESEATARALLNAPTDSVIVIDDQGIILALNEIAASRLGKHSDELIGTLSYDCLPKEVAQRRRLLMAPLLEKKECVRFIDQREGRWYDTVSYPILNETGDVKKIAIIARDITEQKNIEKQIRESEQMYRLLLEQSFDAIAIHKEGKIAFLNEKAVKILGSASDEELIGRSIFDFIHPDSLRDLEERLRNLSSEHGNPAPVLEERFFRVDGSVVTVEVMAIRFDDKGIPAFRVAFREIASSEEQGHVSNKKSDSV